MYIACLCPTYGRPSLVANAMACFMHQELQGHTAELWILDDANQIAPQSGGRDGQRWHIYTEAERYKTLPAKYTRLIELADFAFPDAYVVWDDDDVYLPWHLAAHAGQLESAAWSHPSSVYSTYMRRSLDDPPAIEPAAGRFHGALAIGRECLEAIGGWIQTDRATFDQEMIAALRKHSEPGDPCDVFPRPSYVYRWEDTGHHHCSGVMDRPDWYQLTPIAEPGHVDHLLPAYDGSTTRLLRALQI